MFPRIILTLGLLVGASSVLCQSAVAEVAVDAALMKVLDPDADGTVDLAEAKAAGAAVFKNPAARWMQKAGDRSPAFFEF